VESFTPIINQPNAAILGLCSMENELALIDGQVEERKVTRLCLTYDHRLLDGAAAAKFQSALKALLETPLDILL
jgi:pyruvate dehydrogenase E2 component (dihydrolipoamide acetyltransferase)